MVWRSDVDALDLKMRGERGCCWLGRRTAAPDADADKDEEVEDRVLQSTGIYLGVVE